MAEETGRKSQETPTPAEIAERLRNLRSDTIRIKLRDSSPDSELTAEYVRRLREMYLGSRPMRDVVSSILETLTRMPHVPAFRPAWEIDAATHFPPEYAACAPIGSQSDASEEQTGIAPEAAVAEVIGEAVANAANLLAEELKLYAQVRAQLAEVDEIVERMGRERQEIERLKAETRSNISELQRMIAA